MLSDLLNFMYYDLGHDSRHTRPYGGSFKAEIAASRKWLADTQLKRGRDEMEQVQLLFEGHQLQREFPPV
jgi:hypothetical protein